VNAALKRHGHESANPGNAQRHPARGNIFSRFVSESTQRGHYQL
jgi:hypothetical protein